MDADGDLEALADADGETDADDEADGDREAIASLVKAHTALVSSPTFT